VGIKNAKARMLLATYQLTDCLLGPILAFIFGGICGLAWWKIMTGWGDMRLIECGVGWCKGM